MNNIIVFNIDTGLMPYKKATTYAQAAGDEIRKNNNIPEAAQCLFFPKRAGTRGITVSTIPMNNSQRLMVFDVAVDDYPPTAVLTELNNVRDYILTNTSLKAHQCLFLSSTNEQQTEICSLPLD